MKEAAPMKPPGTRDARAALLAERLRAVGAGRREFLKVPAGLAAMGPAGFNPRPADAAPKLAPGEKLAKDQSSRYGGGGWWQDDPTSHDFNKDLYCNGVPALFAGLMKFNADHQSVLYVASKVTSNSDGSQWAFTIRKDSKWSDGSPCTARDFEWSWKRQLDPASAAPYAAFLYDIRNAQAFNKKEVTDPSQVGVRAKDDWTLEVTLEEVFRYPFPGTWYLIPQVTKPPFDNLKVRRAVAHAIDRANIVKVAQGFAIPAHAMIPPGFPGALDDPKIKAIQHFDAKLAMAQLRGTPFEGGKNWPKVTLTMRDEALGSKPLAEAVQSVLLEHLNMKTDLEVLEPRVFRERLWKQDLQFVWIRWFMDYPDPHNEYFDTFYGKKTTGKRQAWVNDAFDRELEAGRSSSCRRRCRSTRC